MGESKEPSSVVVLTLGNTGRLPIGESESEGFSWLEVCSFSKGMGTEEKGIPARRAWCSSTSS